MIKELFNLGNKSSIGVVKVTLGIPESVGAW